MKKIFILMLTCIMLLSGCNFFGMQDGDGIKIVCTSFPYYDFAKNIAGDKAEVVLLVPTGTDIHAFDPTPQDMITVSEADIFIANGGESEEWVSKLLDGLDEKPREIIYMTERVQLLESDGHTDEHIWTSPRNAEILSEAICDKLVAIDEANAEYYRANLSEYKAKLSELDKAFRDAVETGNGKTVVFGDRFPFLYLATEYGFDYKAAFSGCSELTEPDARTVSELIEMVRAENVPVVFYVEFSNHTICDTICGETGAEAKLFHSVHNLTKAEFESGASYIGIMTENAAALKEALS